MGNNYTFCNCKNDEHVTEGNFKNDIENNNKVNSQIPSSSSRHDPPFAVVKAKVPLNLNLIKQTAAVNKIIKVYRFHKMKQHLSNVNNNISKKNNNHNHKNSNIGSDNVVYDSSTENSSKLRQMRSISMSNVTTSYIGDKINGMKEGFGMQTWGGGAKYIGYYKANKAEGIGKFIASSDRYEGEFHMDGAYGFGFYHHSNGALYEGEWVDDAQDNLGIETWKDGSKYQGEYSRGKKNGIGVYTWPDGSKYEGEWMENTLNGYGIYYFTNNRVYLGEWKSNMKDGFGEFVWADKKYIGYYANDKKEGFGIYYWEKMNKAFMGFWKQGKQEGFGKYMTKTKMKFGIWAEDNRIKWLENEETALKLLDDEGLKNYKGIFSFTLDDISNYFMNHDVYNTLQKEND